MSWKLILYVWSIYDPLHFRKLIKATFVVPTCSDYFFRLRNVYYDNYINFNIRKIQIGGTSPPSRSTVQTQDLKKGNRRRYKKNLSNWKLQSWSKETKCRKRIRILENKVWNICYEFERKWTTKTSNLNKQTECWNLRIYWWNNGLQRSNKRRNLWFRSRLTSRGGP